ncbi:MAG TPA: SDR family NAD(P)-dependent oxidoreductase, partial [Anaerolineales bacterium]|nr:SDR family NAD(P)-dependent oxidoreductase [Anaerolineales bacterium]
MSGKIALVTGSTSGIGFQIALGLAQLGTTVTLGARSEAQGQQTVDRIRSEIPDSEVTYLVADLSSLGQVRTLAAETLARHPAMQVLVNNVGGYFMQRRLTADGYERTFALNHLSYFLLTRLLLDRLTSGAPARIVNVASAAHFNGRMRFEDLGYRRGYRLGLAAYAQSKLANVLFTKELARRLSGTGVTANAVHPGLVRTGLSTKNTPWPVRPIAALGVAFMAISEVEGASGPLWLASSPEVDGVSGEYFNLKRRVRSSAASND